MANLKAILRKHGYQPELSHDQKRFEKELDKVIPAHRVAEYDALFESKIGLERRIHEFMGDNLRGLKVLLSHQLSLSMDHAEAMVAILKDRKGPFDVLDLGGADGWLIDHIAESCPRFRDGQVVDRNPVWESSCEWSFLAQEYSELKLDRKFQVITSILGAPFEAQKDLFDAVDRHLEEDGVALLSLRISYERDFIGIVNYCNSLGFALDANLSRKITSQTSKNGEERLPLLVLARGPVKELTVGDHMALVRGIFHAAPPVRSMSGLEASFWNDAINELPRVYESTKSFTDGEFSLFVVELNGVRIRLCHFPNGDVVMQYPISVEDLRTDAGEWLSRLPIDYSY